jgi:cytochrome c-type biogenesis protein CcmE
MALSIAAVLAIFLLYTSIAGGGTPSLHPGQVPGHAGRITVGGIVVGHPVGDGHATPLRFRLRDPNGAATVPVVYRGSVPDLFRSGRYVAVDGRLQSGTLVGVTNTLVTKCPSKYAPAKKKASY